MEDQIKALKERVTNRKLNSPIAAARINEIIALIDTASKDGHTSIYVQHKGGGMIAEPAIKVFEKEFRVDVEWREISMTNYDVIIGYKISW